MKQTNKGAQPKLTGQPPAEFVERRPPAKGNPEQTTVTGTQRPESASSGLDSVDLRGRTQPSVRQTMENIAFPTPFPALEWGFRG
jgi:hypothetical protein